MCGLIGKLTFSDQGFNKGIESVFINRSLKLLHHRGPDSRDYYFDRNIWLGITRLSIVDRGLSGQQPMKNEDGTIIIIFNGEIYNYVELRKRLTKKHQFRSHTDTEVIIHLYEDYGINCLKYLRGMFVFAIWDKKRQQLFIARDRIGKKPVKYFYNNKFFIFASELKAFIDHPEVPKEIDWEAVNQFLSYQYVPSPKTGFKNIWKLPPAHYLLVRQSGEVSVKKYWDLDFSQKLNLSEEAWKEKITGKLTESVKLRLSSDLPLGIHLSGGLDSGLITALASLQTKKPLETFSIGFEENEYNELPYSRLIAEKYQTNHHEFIVKPNLVSLLPKLAYQYEEPFADPSILPTWLLMQESKKNVAIALNGDGGDENFAGYARYKVMKLYQLFKFLPFKIVVGKLLLLVNHLFRQKSFLQTANVLGYSNNGYEHLYQELMSFIKKRQKGELFSKSFSSYLQNTDTNDYLANKLRQREIPDNLDRLLALDITTYLPDVLLVKTDVAAMAHSLEVRSPFLDHEFMELTAQIPSNLKLNNNLQSKYILKKIAARYLPEEYIYRKKQPFIPPLKKWFKSELSGYLKAQLLDDKFTKYGIFNKTKLTKFISENQHSQADHTYALWTILMLKQWLDVWFG